MNIRALLILICLSLLFAISQHASFGEAALAPSGVGSAPPPQTSIEAQLDTGVKIIGGIVAAVVAIIGIPLVRIQYKKTLKEIAKLDLEAANLRAKLVVSGAGEREQDGASVNIDQSLRILSEREADPKFLSRFDLYVAMNGRSD
jgi:hypothetical protein